MEFKQLIKGLSKEQGVRTFEQMFDIISELGQGSPSRKTFDKYLLEPKEMSLTMFRGLCKVTNLSPDTMMELILTDHK